MSDTERRRPGSDQSSSFPGARTVLHIRGVPVRFDISAVLTAGVLVYVLFTRFPALLAGFPGPVVAAAVAVAAVLFFASVLAHEVGHAWTSLDRDIPVSAMTFFLFGAVTESTREARTAKDEFVIVGVGPFISLVLGAVFGLVHTAVEGYAVAAAVAGYVAWFNLLLAIFNFLPGYPLDGGRLLRSILWGAVGDPHIATRWAARVGQAFAALLVAFGVWTFVQSGGGGLNGVGPVLVGLFLFRGAAQSHTQARARGRLASQRAGDVMGSVPPALAGHERLSDAVVAVQDRPSVMWPVGSPLVGGLTLDRIDSVPRGEWARTTVTDVAYPADSVTVGSDTGMDVALERMSAAPGNMLIVVEGGRPVGLLTPSLVTGLLQ